MTAHERTPQTYLALLRGINVGGKNIIKMADLRECFETEGFRDVVTYIQSGNVVFRSPSTGLRTLTKKIEGMLAAAFDYEASVVMRARMQMRAVVSDAPAGFGEQPETYRYDVIFLKAPLTVSTAMEGVPTRPGVDESWAGSGVLYFSRRIDQASRSYLSRLASMSLYQRVTVRNWNTTTRLLELMEKA